VELHLPRQTIFWLHGTIASQRALLSRNTIDSGDYDLWHQHLGHPSKHVLYETQKHVKDFPIGIKFPEKESPCRGCTEGKMHLRSFPDSQSRATHPFQRIHSDLKSFPVESYHKYRYLISFIDDFTSNAWVILMRHKDSALKATKNFVAIIETQYKTNIQEWMSDAGGEYKSQEFDDFLKMKGIKILQSVPHQPEQNGRAERFN
jgi:transposase InsO family protein